MLLNSLGCFTPCAWSYKLGARIAVLLAVPGDMHGDLRTSETASCGGESRQIRVGPHRPMKGKTSRAEIAAEAGFDDADVLSRIEGGAFSLPLERAADLARALEVDPAYLLRLAAEDHLLTLTPLVEDAIDLFAAPDQRDILLKFWRKAAADDGAVGDVNRS